METHFIIIQVSAPIYWGFQYNIPLDYALSVTSDTIAKETKQYMKNFFHSHHLEELKEGVDKLNLCLHSDIQPNDTIVYICHCTDTHVDEEKNENTNN